MTKAANDAARGVPRSFASKVKSAIAKQRSHAGISEYERLVIAALRGSIDPVFLPRRLQRVDALPRNDAGKLPRAALLRLLQGSRG